MILMNFFTGCPIWSFKGWVGNFYPQGTKPGDFLHEYTRRLTTVEGNTTFYAVPSRDTIQGWAAEMVEGFRFCPKLPRTISHSGKISDHIEEAFAFIEIMTGLGSNLGPMFLQLPPRYSPRQFDDLKAFLQAWPRNYRLAVEVRHLDWFETPHHDSLNRLLREYNMARIVIDTRPIRDLKGDEILRGSVYGSLLEARERKPDVPVIPEGTADFVFLRYIGHPSMPINQPFLSDWGDYLAKQIRLGLDAFVFCHSPENLTAPWLCRALYQRVAEQVKIRPLPWDEVDSNTFEQGRLF
jgi:uncharacterized protein YecE (DUF72 family)